MKSSHLLSRFNAAADPMSQDWWIKPFFFFIQCCIVPKLPKYHSKTGTLLLVRWQMNWNQMFRLGSLLEQGLDLHQSGMQWEHGEQGHNKTSLHESWTIPKAAPSSPPATQSCHPSPNLVRELKWRDLNPNVLVCICQGMLTWHPKPSCLHNFLSWKTFWQFQELSQFLGEDQGKEGLKPKLKLD